MAGVQQTSNRVTIITDAHSKPINEREREVVTQLVINALQGSWGKGSWTGGTGENWVPGVGWWEKHRECWDATLKTTLTGTATMTLPFPVTNGIVKVYKIAEDGSATLSANYIEIGNTLIIDHIGAIIVELSNIRNVREVTV